MTSRFSTDRSMLVGAGLHGRHARTRLAGVVLLLGAAAVMQSAAIFPADAQATTCDEALRTELSSTQLPDCRAYEMVSPPYKQGFPLSIRGYASNGESAILDGLATLAENPGSGESTRGALYSDTRTSSGWQLAPLNAPLSEYVGQIPLAAEADNGETLWNQHPPDQPASSRGLYIRSASGAYSFVGPLSPHDYTGEEASDAINKSSASYDAPVAATSDYSHVLLNAADGEDRWPFDQTTGEARSLYEYSGTENATPTLVGVTGGKGSTSLIGFCGTTLGSANSSSAYNALSADGETVFFTVLQCGAGPATDELYARLHGSSTSATSAETVHVSASECTEACGAESGKNFEGASEAGSLLYFTSTQKLTDAAVNGTSGGDATTGRGCASLPAGEGGCNLYVYDFAAPSDARLKAVSVGGEVLGVMGIAEDGSRVYYASRAAIPSAGENPYGQAPIVGQPNVYVYDDTNGETAFVATLGGADARDWSRELSRPDELAGESGHFLLFASSTPNITPDDTSSLVQLFEYKAPVDNQPEEAPELVRVTKGEGSFNDDGNAVSVGVQLSPIESVTEQLGDRADFKSTTNRSNMSTDGRTVFFATAGQLSPRATSAALGCGSVYEFHTTTDTLAEGEVHLISDGRDTQPNKGVACGAQFQGVNATGADVLFSTADPLLASDTDGVQRDTYDARIGGGFESISEAASCFLELCAETPDESEAQPATADSTGQSEAPAGGASPQAAESPPQAAGSSTQPAAGVSPPRTPATASRPARSAGSCRHRSHMRHGVCVRSAKRRARSARRASDSKGGR